MNDFLGRPLAIGDEIVYGGRAGTTGYIAVGRIVRFNTASITVVVIKHSGYPEAGATSVVQATERVVKLAKFE